MSVLLLPRKWTYEITADNRINSRLPHKISRFLFLSFLVKKYKCNRMEIARDLQGFPRCYLKCTAYSRFLVSDNGKLVYVLLLARKMNVGFINAPSDLFQGHGMGPRNAAIERRQVCIDHRKFSRHLTSLCQEERYVGCHSSHRQRWIEVRWLWNIFVVSRYFS